MFAVVTLAPGTDTAGESLSALRFAARASKVSVKAQVNRYKDYEALYREMKVKLKEFQSKSILFLFIHLTLSLLVLAIFYYLIMFHVQQTEGRVPNFSYNSSSNAVCRTCSRL